MARLARRHPVGRVCQVLGVSRSGYYARRNRDTPARVREDRRLKQQILAAHTAARGRYGTPRIERALRRNGIRTSRKRVARLRRELGLQAKGRWRLRVTTVPSSPGASSGTVARRFLILCARQLRCQTEDMRRSSLSTDIWTHSP